MMYSLASSGRQLWKLSVSTLSQKSMSLWYTSHDAPLGASLVSMHFTAITITPPQLLSLHTWGNHVLKIIIKH